MKDKILKRNLIFFSIFSLIEYLIFHTFYLSDGIGELSLHIIRFSVTVFPALVGIGIIKDGIFTQKNILNIAIIYAARLPFFFLYIYVIAHELFRMTSVEIILYAILFSLVLALLYFLLSLAVYYITRWRVKKSARSIEDSIPLKITDFKNPITVGLLSLPLLFFAFEFSYEIYNTVIYLIAYASDYRLSEIIYLVAEYLFILIKLIITALLGKLLVNRVL